MSTPGPIPREECSLSTTICYNHDVLLETINKLELCKSQVSIGLNHAKNDAERAKGYLDDHKFMVMIDSDVSRCEKMKNMVYDIQNMLQEIKLLIRESGQRDSGVSLNGTGSPRSSLERESGNMENVQEIPKDTVEDKEPLQQKTISLDDIKGQGTENKPDNEQKTDATLVEINGDKEDRTAHGTTAQTTSRSNAELQSSNLHEDRLNNLSNELSDEDNTHEDPGVDRREQQQMAERPLTAVCATAMSLGEDEQRLLDANSGTRKGKSQQRKEAIEHDNAT